MPTSTAKPTAGSDSEVVDGTVTASAVIGDPLPPGTSATVKADGECLRVREEPALTGRQLGCIPEGSTVAVLPSVQTSDGYRWQLISRGALTGWAADQYLIPYIPPVAPPSPPPSVVAPPSAAVTAGCTAARASTTIQPGFTGFVPNKGGVGMVIWGGGTLSGIDTAATARGCSLSAVWSSDADGEMVPFIVGVPDFVNASWRKAFPTGRVPSGKVLFLVCSEPDTARASISAVPVPGFTAKAPVFTRQRPAPSVSASAAVVIDEASGAVLFGKNARQPLPPASLTKIATAIVAIEGAESSSWVVTDVDSRKMYGSSVAGLVPGDCFNLNDLLYGLMLPSGNDAALAIARYGAGTDDAFVQQMNTLVGRLGLKESHFTDPHGLGSPEHLQSAYDIAMLSRYGMSLPAFREIVKAPTWTANGMRSVTLWNVNSFLRGYPGADGVKTGFTDEAGRTLSASAVKNGRRDYVVLLNDPNRDADATALLDWAFENHSRP